MVQKLFPNLFIDGVESINYNIGKYSYIVKRSPINPHCVIIIGNDALDFVFQVAHSFNLSPDWVDLVKIYSNTNGISIENKDGTARKHY